MNWDITGFYGTFLGNYAPKVPIHCHNPCKTFVKQIICFEQTELDKNDKFSHLNSIESRFHAETNKNPHPASQLHADQTNNKLYLYEKTNTTNKLLYDDYYQGDF